MSEVIEAFKKHWFISLLGICVAVAATTWKFTSEIVERPLKNQIADADRQASIWRDQVAIAEKQLAQARTIPNPPVAAAPTQPGSQPKEDPGFASGACSILDAGNKLYTERKFTEAIEKYLTVQNVDKFGKSACVGSIYATIGTIYALIGEPMLSSSPSDAAQNFRLANSYNRAFAAAVICYHGDCKLSEALWANGI